MLALSQSSPEALPTMFNNSTIRTKTRALLPAWSGVKLEDKLHSIPAAAIRGPSRRGLLLLPPIHTPAGDPQRRGPPLEPLTLDRAVPDALLHLLHEMRGVPVGHGDVGGGGWGLVGEEGGEEAVSGAEGGEVVGGGGGVVEGGD